MDTEKIYFMPGDVVRCNKLTNSPEMYVIRKKELTFKDGENKDKILLGMVCRWFTDGGLLQESIFSTKDISKVK